MVTIEKHEEVNALLIALLDRVRRDVEDDPSARIA